jgi:hypothetical protein
MVFVIGFCMALTSLGGFNNYLCGRWSWLWLYHVNTRLDEYEIYNSTDDETSKEIEEEWHPDDDVRIRGHLVYTMPEVSAESRCREHRRNERINYFAEN